ncbi:hypothetical protein RND71_013766 [Anisodus tanguticus]|uniref:AAA+ ATPase domain-containing protein n=1 Tax=Anisodus tanguticus TaxID=243964 RepID=A0AAE1SBC9_9SOLA|nr:hypothetical protein RND71_013766 [Anisodus tanguticus]
MAETISLMDIDNAKIDTKPNKGKNTVFLTSNTEPKSVPWVEKFRPQSLSDVAAHRDIVETIDRLASSNRLPHLLLYGPPGTGKTSTILALARKLYGNQMHNMVLELNASDDRGIDVVRQQIQDFASTQSISFGAKSAVKLVLLDEADAMTKDAQFALRRGKKLPLFHVTLNICARPAKLIVMGLFLLQFAPLDAVHVSERLKHVIEAERLIQALSYLRLDVPEGGLKALVRLSNGDMRKALNILQAMVESRGDACSGLVVVFGGWVGGDFLGSLCLFKEETILGERKKSSSNIVSGMHETTGFVLLAKKKGRPLLENYKEVMGSSRGNSLLQKCEITEEAVYLCTGNPLPKDIEQISYWLLNEPFAISCKRISMRISDIKTIKGLALVDIVREVTMFVFKIKMPADVRVQLINEMADIEYRLTFGCNDKLQLGSLIAAFTRARSALVAAAK